MRKKSNQKKEKKNIIDVSYRKNLHIDSEKTYSDEELQILISELQKQMEQMKLMEQKYYSMNASIERISRRNFIDIIKEKFESVVSAKS